MFYKNVRNRRGDEWNEMVGRKGRKRVGTPRALRTNVEGPNALGLASATGATTTSGTGGLNV